MRRARLIGGIAGVGLGLCLMGWAVAVDVVDLPFGDEGGSAREIQCPEEEGLARTDCNFIKVIGEMGESVGGQVEGMVLSGILTATLILVLVGVAIGGWIEQRRQGVGHMSTPPPATRPRGT